MCDIIYLHGFGVSDPSRCHVAIALEAAIRSTLIHRPHYHPEGSVFETRLAHTLSECEDIIERSNSSSVHLVGYSFGGLLAAILAERPIDKIGKVLLLAPAIDNYDRNYAHSEPRHWRMPVDYVEELRRFPARPSIVRPTTLVHGMLDGDKGGSHPRRIEEWGKVESFADIYLVDRTGHSLEPWLSANNWINDNGQRIPTFRRLIEQLLS